MAQPTRRQLALGLAAAALLLGAAALRADGPAPPLLHEYVPIAPSERVGGHGGGAAGGAGRAGATGAALDEEPIYGPQPLDPVIAIGPPRPGDAPPERRDRVVPDRDTERDPGGRHPYHEVFSPSVTPFKRMTALDAVLEDESLYVWDATRRPLPAAAPPAPARDRFRAEVVVDLSPGRWVPLPSVAADTRVLAHRIEAVPARGGPAPALEFARDSADNVYVRARAEAGRHRLSWDTDAAPRYFGGDLPRGGAAGETPPALLHPLPPALRRRAASVLERIGVRAEAPFEQTLGQLVAWFRSFEMGALPSPGDSTYLDLARAKKGACRHRAYAFTVTAIAAGLAARYVENELHAFVEVYVPRLGWRQIDLGGAAMPHELHGAQGKPPYRRGSDPLPKPHEYLRDGTAGEGPRAPGREGSSSEPAQHGRSPTGTGTAAGAGATAGTATRPGSATGNQHAGAGGTETATGPGEPRATGDPGAATPSAAMPVKPRAHTTISVASPAREVFRGDVLRVSGHLAVAGADAAGVRVLLELVGPDGRAVPLGDTLTAAGGRFEAEVEAPRTLPLGHHRLIARTDGDEARAPARSAP